MVTFANLGSVRHTKFEVRRPSRSEDTTHLVCQLSIYNRIPVIRTTIAKKIVIFTYPGCDVLQGLALLIYYIALYFSSFASWSILDDVGLFVVSASGFFQWFRSRSVVVCRSGMWVWRLIESFRPNMLEVL